MIDLILGPMFSGKSSELLRKARRFQIAKKKCLVINYANDNRYRNEDVICTHDKLTFLALKCQKIREVEQLYRNYDVIAIDQAQFFPDLVEMCEVFTKNEKVVIVAGLDGTFQRKPFGSILELIPLAERVCKLSAICVYCCDNAAFTQRIVDNSEVELIGGEELYKPTCRKCFQKEKKQLSYEDQKITKGSLEKIQQIN